MKTAKIALLGSNISYSLSPRIFHHPSVQQLFPCHFSLKDLPNLEAWEKFWKHEAYSYDFLCITTPWKRHVLSLPVATLSPEVASSHIANWVAIEHGTLTALNTDYFAFNIWWNHLPQLPTSIYYLGTGASSLTFLALLKEKMQKNAHYKPRIFLVTRDLENAQQSGCYSYLKVSTIDYTQLYLQNFLHHDLIINGSFYGQKEPFPIELVKTFEKTMIWDLNYAYPTPYISFYQKQGLEFLTHQALCFLTHQKNISADEFKNLSHTLCRSLAQESPTGNPQ